MPRLPRLKLSPLPSVVTLAIGDEAERLGLEVPNVDVDGRTTDGDGFLCLWLNAGVLSASWPDIAATIAHEALHVVDYAFERVGESALTDEIRAYYIGSIVEWAAAEVDKRRGSS